MATYSYAFKEAMVAKLVGPNARPIREVVLESGVSKSALYCWLANAGKEASMAKKNNSGQGRWSADDKLALLAQAAGLSEDELGTFLRNHGLYAADLQRWRELATAGLNAAASPSKQAASAENRRIRELERELRRKDKALAEASALLILKKKAQAIWGDEDDITTKVRGR